jgi:hypothetical protein
MRVVAAAVNLVLLFLLAFSLLAVWGVHYPEAVAAHDRTVAEAAAQGVVLAIVPPMVFYSMVSAVLLAVGVYLVWCVHEAVR